MSELKSEWVKENWDDLNNHEVHYMESDIPENIRRLAYENSNSNFNGVVYANSDGECFADTWSSNTSLSDESECIIIFTARAGWDNDYTLEDIFGSMVREVIDHALENGLNSDYEYDAGSVVEHAQKHNCIDGSSWEELCIEAQLEG